MSEIEEFREAIKKLELENQALNERINFLLNAMHDLNRFGCRAHRETGVLGK